MMRVHRSAFVRPGAVREISQVRRQLVLASGTAVRVGPLHADEVRHRLRGESRGRLSIGG